MNRDFQILYQDGNTVKVTGRDLVYKIPETIVDQQNTGVITVIPANPCYWLGTRIAALAQGYQNYRPLAMKFTYIPQCAVTQQGNVIAGTLWNQAPSNDNLQQSLRTSNGGQLSQCYKGFTSIVRLKSNLQYNLYKTAGQFDQESNPFIYMAIAVSCLNSSNQKIIPGYFYVTWSFLLKNPIGNTNIFYNSGITNFQYVKDNATYENKTIVYLQPGQNDVQMGAIIQVENDAENTVAPYYNGSYYNLGDEDKVWYFANSTIQQTNALARENQGILYYRDSHYDEQAITTIPTCYYFREAATDASLWYCIFFKEIRAVDFRAHTQYYYFPDYFTPEKIGNLLEQRKLQRNIWSFGYINTPLFHGGELIGWSFVVPKLSVSLQQYTDPAIKKNITQNVSVKKLVKQINEELEENEELKIVQARKVRKIEECIADFEEDKKLKTDVKDTQANNKPKGETQEGSNHCIVVRPPGKTKSDGYLKQERKPTSATNIFKSNKKYFTNSINEDLDGENKNSSDCNS